MAAQGYKDPLQIHGRDVHIGRLRGPQGLPAAAHRRRLVPAQRLGGEDLQPPADPVHLILPAGDQVKLGHQFIHRALLDDLPPVQKEHVLKDGGRLLNDMGGEKEGSPRLSKVLQQQLVKALPHDHVQTGRRLIQNGHRGPAGQTDEHRHQGALTFGEGVDFLPGVQRKGFQQTPGIRLVPVGEKEGGRVQIVPDFQAVAPAQHGLGQLPGEAQLPQNLPVLPHPRPAVGDRTALVGVLPGEDAQQRGFARAVAADEAVNFPRLHRQVQVPQDVILAVGFVQAGGLQYRAVHSDAPSPMACSTIASSSPRSRPRERPSRTMGRT